MLKGDTDPEKRPVSSARQSDHEKRPIWNIVEENNHRQYDKENNGLQTNVFLAAQTNHGRIGTDQRQVSQGTPTRTRSEEEHGHTHPGYAGGTGITIISGYWNKRNGGNPFSQITTRQAEKPVSDNTGIPDRIDRHMGPTHTGQGTLR